MAGDEPVQPEGNGPDVAGAPMNNALSSSDAARTDDADGATQDATQAGRNKFWPISATLRWLTSGVILLVLALLALLAWLHTAPGRQFIVDEIAKVAPASGLSVEVGRIDGSILWGSTLYDVKLRDANKVLFLEIPEVDLNWRPHKFPFGGLDVRHLILRRGTLYAVPELVPGDPDAPILPDFDIRIDRFAIDDLRIAKELIGEERIVGFRAKADIRKGRVLLKADGNLGGTDTLKALLDAEPDGDRFDVDVDYRAPAGGLLAELAGTDKDTRLRLKGDGTWTQWIGGLVVNQGDANLAALRVHNNAGLYKVVGQLRPGEFVTGLPAEALGEAVSLALVGSLEDSVLSGGYALRAAAISAGGEGIVDLGDNVLRNVTLKADLLNPRLFGDALTITDGSVDAVLDGPLQSFTVKHRLEVGRLDAGGTVVTGLVQDGVLTWDGNQAVIPLNLQVARVVSGNAMVDPRLINGRGTGLLVYSGNRLMADDLAVRFPGLQADLALRGDLDQGLYSLSGPVRANGIALEGLGSADAAARIRFEMGATKPWTLAADFSGRLARVTNETLANLAGTNIQLRGGVSLGEGRPILFRRTSLTASKLRLTVDGSIDGDKTTLSGSGRHTEYGPFNVEAEMSGSGPRAVLVFDSPLPAAGLREVRVSIAPTDNGFAIDTQGQSVLGPFDGLLELVSPANGPTRVTIQRFDVSNTSITGEIALADGGISGGISLTGGGIDGNVTLTPQAAGQHFAAIINARNAEFSGVKGLAIRNGLLNAEGVVGSGGLTVNGTLSANGVTYGTLLVSRVAARAQMVDGVGSFDASVSGRRGRQFELDLTGQAAAERMTLAVRGSYADRAISMPRRAVLAKLPDGGWSLERTQVTFGEGNLIAEGRMGGHMPTQGRLSLLRMPLSLLDLVVDDLGFGGTVSGIVDASVNERGQPIGDAKIKVDGLTRSGLVLTSRPMDIAVVSRLTTNDWAARALMNNRTGDTRGRVQAQITNMPQTGGIVERLFAGNLLAQLRYDGPAASVWRLAAIDLIDIRGPLKLAADVRGTLANPQVRGSLSGDALQVQSGLTGSNITDVQARGRFVGMRLNLTSFAGNAPNGGKVNGSGFIDLSGLTSGQGPQIDLRLGLRDAEVMDLPTMGGTATGPLRIVSNGSGGTVAGKLRIREARWALGMAADAEELPDIAVREINSPVDRRPLAARSLPWRYLIDADAPGGIDVDGMGLDSEWRGSVRLRGTTADPRIGGQVQIVPRQGFYSFAGTRFEITRGVIDFDETVPINPRINLLAEADVRGLAVDVSITGNAQKPEIVFNSSQGLPQEEILARLLFGGSVANLSATDALQLGSAIASLSGGGGLGPINQLRSAIGLDRLRLIAADPALRRGTAVALGKNFGRRFYGEIITDGGDYNATELEFRLTNWLSLLATIDTMGRGGAAGEFSRDY